MKISKRILSIILASIIITYTSSMYYFCVPVKAAVGVDDAWDALKIVAETIGANEDVLPGVLRDAFYKSIIPNVGIIPKNVGIMEMEWMRQGWANYLNRKYSNSAKTKDNLTQSDYNEIARDLTQNITLNDNKTITYNSTSKGIYNDCVDALKSNSGYDYRYGYDIRQSVTTFSSAELYQATTSLINQKVQEGFIYNTFGYTPASPVSNTYFLVLIKGDSEVVGLRNNYVNSMYGFDIDYYHQSDWDNILNHTDLYEAYKYNYSTHQYESFTVTIPGTYSRLNAYMYYKPGFGRPGTSQAGYTNYFTYFNGTTAYGLKTYASLNDLKNGSVGNQPYFVDNTVYNNWINSSGDYTTSVNTNNYTSYGDITNYIDSYNTENGNYPSTKDINVFIDTNNEDTRQEINNQGGQGGQGGEGGQGGSGGSASANANNEGINININNNHNLIIGGSTLSGNSVSGNNGGSVGTISGIFDWLGSIGNIIGQFIKNIGEAITGVFEGIVSAITTIVDGIPNVFAPLISFIFGGLPDELQAVITLGITAVILIGIIKSIRG